MSITVNKDGVEITGSDIVTNGIIKDYPLLTSSKEVYLLFYIKTD